MPPTILALVSAVGPCTGFGARQNLERSGSRAKRHCGIPIPQPLPSLSSTRCPGAAWTTCSPPIHRPRIASPRSIDCRMKWVSVALVHRGRLPQAPGPALGATALSASEGVCSVGKSNKNLVFLPPAPDNGFGFPASAACNWRRRPLLFALDAPDQGFVCLNSFPSAAHWG